MPYSNTGLELHLTALRSAVFNTLEEQIAVIDQQGDILDVNQAWLVFGCSNGMQQPDNSLRQNYLQILTSAAAGGDQLAADALQGIHQVISGQQQQFCLEYPCHSTTEQRWFIMRIAPLYGDDSRNVFVISHHNITARKLMEEQIAAQAMQDHLTGLSNRRAFYPFVSRLLRSCLRQQQPVGFILLDVDFFKAYNDKFGHAAGDQCLSQISQILRNHARRPDDLAVRLGGDEFALVLGHTTPETTRQIAETITREVQQLNLLIGKNRQVTVSIGCLAMVPAAEHQDEHYFLQAADKALYQAKSAGRNCVVAL